MESFDSSAPALRSVAAAIDDRRTQPATVEGVRRKPLLSMAETAAYLGIGKQSVYQMAAENRLPVVRLTRGKRTIKVIRSILDEIVARGLLGAVLPPPDDYRRLLGEAQTDSR